MATTATASALNFVVFYVSDIEASHDFFARTLGLTTLPEGDGPGFRQFAAGPGGSGFGLLQASEQTPPPGAAEVYFGTDDIVALRDAWIANGATVAPIVQMPFGKICEVVTPDGRTLTALQS